MPATIDAPDPTVTGARTQYSSITPIANWTPGNLIGANYVGANFDAPDINPRRMAGLQVGQALSVSNVR